MVVKDKHGNPKTHELITTKSIRITRHIKIKANTNPFDPKEQDYFLTLCC